MHSTCIIQQVLSLRIQCASVCLGRARCRRQGGLSGSERELTQTSSGLRLTHMLRIKLPLEVTFLFISSRSTILIHPPLGVTKKLRFRHVLPLRSVLLRVDVFDILRPVPVGILMVSHHLILVRPPLVWWCRRRLWCLDGRRWRGLGINHRGRHLGALSICFARRFAIPL